jgi:hypothetical protein
MAARGIGRATNGSSDIRSSMTRADAVMSGLTFRSERAPKR